MSASEKHVRLAAELYGMRDAARQILGGNYEAQMRRLGAVLSHRAKVEGKDLLQVLMDVLKGASSAECVMFAAAVVELTEPSASTVQGEESGKC